MGGESEPLLGALPLWLRARGSAPAPWPSRVSYQEASRWLGRGYGGQAQHGSQPVEGPQLHIRLEVSQVQGQLGVAMAGSGAPGSALRARMLRSARAVGQLRAGWEGTPLSRNKHRALPDGGKESSGRGSGEPQHIA